MSTNKTIPCSIKEQNNSVVFDCCARNLKKIPAPTVYMSNSVELLLNQNLIQTIYKPSLQTWKNLTKLDLSWNHYSKKKLEPPCYRGLEINNETFANLTKLEHLLIDHNYLCKIPSGLPDTVKILSFQYNNIFSLSKRNFSRFKRLKNLYLSNNCYYANRCLQELYIQNGTFSDLLELEVLSLSSNNLTHVPPYLPASLKELYLVNNRIQVIQRDDFQNLVNLEVLHLSGNCPRCYNSEYPCFPCPGTTSLEIDDQAFGNLKKLTVLNLASTSLSTISNSWFFNLSQLIELNLQSNYLISEIAIGEFLSYLPNLQRLDLSFNYNRMSYPDNINISGKFSKLVSLRELHMQGYVFKEVTSENLGPLTKLSNLSIINLSVNFISRIDFKAFADFPSLHIIYLSENRITTFSETTKKTRKLLTFYSGDHISLEPDIMYNTIDNDNKVYKDITPVNLVKPQCSAYGKTLDLSLNSIIFIDPEEFRPFSDVACLNLSSNGIGQNLNGTEFIYLTNLSYLDLSFNKLDFASLHAFQELKKLEVLDVSYNKHYFVVQGVTHHLKFIENLTSLAVLNLSWNEISMLTESQIKSQSLKELRFAGNRLDMLWKYEDNRYLNLFSNFSNLSILDISYNRLHSIPNDAVCRNLTELYLKKNHLVYFGWEGLRCLKNLKFLDLANNKLTMIAHLGNFTTSLSTLIISFNYIQSLDDAFLFRLRSLTDLDLSYNHIEGINNSSLLSANDNYFKVLKLKGNPFQCTCEIIYLINWINNNNVTIPLATDVTCATPDNWKKQGIIHFNIHACNEDFKALLLFHFSFVLIVPLISLPILSSLLYWDLWYIYHWCFAKYHWCLGQQKYSRLNSLGTVYDAFITFDDKDPAVSDWVYNELCCQIENKETKHVLLCLEERDWEPGRAVIDNIADSINRSKKTIFVLTKNFVNSGKFRTAFYLAMQKLMDENMDVIVIVLLQPVLQHSQYLRLRKKICKSSILEWPKNPHAGILFWQKMKNVLLTENVSRHSRLYSDSIDIAR
ncbi:LOW QUALITY PROTEIN: toll-like receptor 8 [Gastrophryne carolinensis]